MSQSPPMQPPMREPPPPPPSFAPARLQPGQYQRGGVDVASRQYPGPVSDASPNRSPGGYARAHLEVRPNAPTTDERPVSPASSTEEAPEEPVRQVGDRAIVNQAGTRSDGGPEPAPASGSVAAAGGRPTIEQAQELGQYTELDLLLARLENEQAREGGGSTYDVSVATVFSRQIRGADELLRLHSGPQYVVRHSRTGETAWCDSGRARTAAARARRVRPSKDRQERQGQAQAEHRWCPMRGLQCESRLVIPKKVAKLTRKNFLSADLPLEVQGGRPGRRLAQLSSRVRIAPPSRLSRAFKLTHALGSFHERCITSWLARNRKCPLCRANVFKGDDEDNPTDANPSQPA